MIPTVLVRYGEVFLKKGNRSRFLRVLRKNLENAVRFQAGLPNARVDTFHGRFQVVAGDREDELPAGCDKLMLQAVQHTFGVSSGSPAVQVARDYEAIEAACLSLADQAVGSGKVTTFKIATSRSDKTFPMRSPDVNAALGAKVVERHGLKVRMADPDLTISVEIFAHGAYVFTQTVRGPGGLPVGTGGRVLLLLSGGIDSPVAGWMMGKRGCSVSAVHFHSYPFTTQKSIQKVEELATSLKPWLGHVRVTMVPLAPVQEYLRDSAPSDKLVLLYRRSMFRIASALASANRCSALVTGESLGQVASQTLENMRVIQDATDLLVLRPLVGMDKLETVEMARRIGTFEISTRPHEDCCSLFVPAHPDTRGNLDFIKRCESGLEKLADLEREALAQAVPPPRTVQPATGVAAPSSQVPSVADPEK